MGTQREKDDNMKEERNGKKYNIRQGRPKLPNFTLKISFLINNTL